MDAVALAVDQPMAGIWGLLATSSQLRIDAMAIAAADKPESSVLDVARLEKVLGADPIRLLDRSLGSSGN